MNKQEALEVFDGVMLGDAGLCMHGKNAKFVMDLSRGDKQELLGYLSHVKDALLAMELLVCNGHPKWYTTVCKGKPFDYCWLVSQTSPILTAEFRRWYPYGIKEVPTDVKIMPRSVAYWFMDDGCSTTYDMKPDINVHLSAYSFSLTSISLLEQRLQALGLLTGRSHSKNIAKGSGIRLNILQGSVNDFMHMIDPFVVEPYRYKIKYRNDHKEENMSRLVHGEI